MRITTCNLALLLAATVMTGCLSAIPYTSAPGASGRVVDSIDHAPVPHAIVTLIPDDSHWCSDKIVPVKVRTSRRGLFHISKQKDWVFFDVRSPALPDIRPCAPALLRVQHPGYALFETNIGPDDFPLISGKEPGGDFNLGDICLKRIPK